MKNNTYIAKTMFGLEKVLADEINELGGGTIKLQNRAISFTADLETLYKINLASRLSLRILYPIMKFRAKDADSLYRSSQKYNWTSLLKTDNTFIIDNVVNSRYFKHSKYAALKLKDAIIDQFRAKRGNRPNIEIDHPDFRINLHIDEDFCTIALDASGESLHKRGYRLNRVKAPLNEVLAAGMIVLSGWDKESNIIDPMCGSGTIILEAAMMALNIPPNISRKNFGFMRWNSFDLKLFNSVKNKLISERKSIDFSIIGNDINKYSLNIARANAKQAKVDRFIKFTNYDFFNFKPDLDSGIIIINPPYGERLKNKNENLFYQKIGNTLKQNFNNFDAWVLSSNKEALKHLGLRTSRRLLLFNGALECKYHSYELYKGSRKRKYEL